MRLAHLHDGVPDADLGMVHNPIGRNILHDLLRSECPLQETDQRLCPLRVQIRVHIVQPLRHVAGALAGRDVPEVAGGILHCAGALAIILIDRFVDQSSASSHGLSNGRVRVLYIHVQSARLQRSRKFLSGDAPADHNDGVSNLYFAVDARRHHEPAQLFGSEARDGEVEQRHAIFCDQIWRDHAEAGTDVGNALAGHLPAFRTFVQALHSAVHLVDRHLFCHGERTPGIAEGILQGRIAMSVKLVLWSTHEFHPGCYGMLSKRIHIGYLHRHPDRRLSESFGAEAASLGPLASYVDARLANSELGVRNGIAHLETEHFFRSQRFLVKLNRFHRISESQSGGCGRAHGCDGFGYGRHTFSYSQFRFQSCLEFRIRQIAQFRRDAH